jgi:hypothetical protein
MDSGTLGAAAGGMVLHIDGVRKGIGSNAVGAQSVIMHAVDYIRKCVRK